MFVPLILSPTPCANLPISLAIDLIQISLYLGLAIKCLPFGLEIDLAVWRSNRREISFVFSFPPPPVWSFQNFKSYVHNYYSYGMQDAPIKLPTDRPRRANPLSSLSTVFRALVAPAIAVAVVCSPLLSSAPPRRWLICLQQLFRQGRGPVVFGETKTTGRLPATPLRRAAVVGKEARLLYLNIYYIRILHT